MSKKEITFNSDTSNLINGNSINESFANSFFSSIISNFRKVYNLLEANRILNFKNAPKDVKTITHDEQELHKYSRMNIWK